MEAAIESLSQGQRKLAAIMFTDMVGFTALTQSNEAEAMEVLERHNRLIRPFFARFHGREVKAIGDSFLAEFDSALDAIRCAADIQSYLHDYNASRRDAWRIRLRIGIHLGDVIYKAGDVFGDAVNIASRIQPLADPEGICVSEEVRNQVENKFELRMLSLGERFLKNLSAPVVVYKVVQPWENTREEGRTREPDLLRIAILPLTNMSPDPADGYFADGLTEELISSISNVRELNVTSRTSVMGYKGKDKKAGEIAKELGVGVFLEGSVRKSANKVRIAVQLIEAGSDKHLWSSSYDKELDDVFAIQSDIAKSVASELRIQLVDSEKRILDKKSTESIEAYTDFLRGEEQLRLQTEKSLRRAAELFEEAIRVDPLFAKAHAKLGYAINELGNMGYEAYEATISKAEGIYNRALEIDPDLAEAHAGLSIVHLNRDEMGKAEAEARRAVALNPSLPQAYEALWYVTSIREGMTEETVKLIETYYRLDPMNASYIADYGMALFFRGKEKEAFQHWDKTIELSPVRTHMQMTDYFLMKGDFGKAREHRAEVERLDPSHPFLVWTRGFLAAKEGDREGALRLIQELKTKGGTQPLNQIAFISYALGDLDSYFKYLNLAMDNHTLLYFIPMFNPLFAEARADPRFLELVKRMRTTP